MQCSDCKAPARSRRSHRALPTLIGLRDIGSLRIGQRLLCELSFHQRANQIDCSVGYEHDTTSFICTLYGFAEELP